MSPSRTTATRGTHTMLPFQVSRLFSTRAKVHGWALVKPEGVKLVFHDEGVDVDPDGVDVQAATIRWKNLKRVSVDHGLLESHVIFEVHSLAGLDDLPSAKEGKVTIDIAKRDKDKIQQFQRDIHNELGSDGGSLDDEVDDLIDDVRSMFDRRNEF